MKVNNINRSVENILTTVDKVGESQNRVQEILGDLYDIIKDMNRMDDGEPQDTELLQKIKDISQRMNQVNLGQESVKEIMMELGVLLREILLQEKEPIIKEQGRRGNLDSPVK